MRMKKEIHRKPCGGQNQLLIVAKEMSSFIQENYNALYHGALYMSADNFNQLSEEEISIVHPTKGETAFSRSQGLLRVGGEAPLYADGALLSEEALEDAHNILTMLIYEYEKERSLRPNSPLLGWLDRAL